MHMAGEIPQGDLTVKITERDGINDQPYGDAPVDTIQKDDPNGPTFRTQTTTTMNPAGPQ